MEHTIDSLNQKQLEESGKSLLEQDGLSTNEKSDEDLAKFQNQQLSNRKMDKLIENFASWFQQLSDKMDLVKDPEKMKI